MAEPGGRAQLAHAREIVTEPAADVQDGFVNERQQVLIRKNPLECSPPLAAEVRFGVPYSPIVPSLIR